MTNKYFDPENVSLRFFFAVAFAFALSFTFPIRIRIIVGGFGDVTDALGTVWTLSTGIATFVSLVLAVRNHQATDGKSDSTGDSSGVDTKIQIKTVEGDLHLNGTLERDEESRHDSNNSKSADRDQSESASVTAE